MRDHFGAFDVHNYLAVARPDLPLIDISFAIWIHRHQLASQVTSTSRPMLLHENGFGLNLYGYICHINRGVGTRGDIVAMFSRWPS
jgi:hypothetical protein